MTKLEFLADKDVIDFITWISSMIDKDAAFHHIYQTKRPKKYYEFNNIYDAFEKYYWGFNYLNEDNKKIKGSTYSESSSILNSIKTLLDKSIKVNDYELCKTACNQILEWGGVLPQNKRYILALDKSIVNYMNNAYALLCDIDDISNPALCELYMSSGFTKIYSILVKDFVIYDSRVGAALCFFIRKYCEEKGKRYIPPFLIFSWALSRETTYTSINNNTRNPGSQTYFFPTFTNNKQKHISDNIKANWLLKAILSSTYTKFNLLPKNEQLRAFEAALFMIGYQVNFRTALA